MATHSSGLSIQGQRVSNNEIRLQNQTALQTLSNILKSSLGPSGLDKMIINEQGDITITNDGATILRSIEVLDPAAKILIELAELQEREVGDGTTSVVLLACELLKRGVGLITGGSGDGGGVGGGSGVHPTNVISGYRLAMKEAVRHIRAEMGQKVDGLGREALEQVAATTLSSKFAGGDSDFFSKLVVDAVLSVKIKNVDGKFKYPVNQINILKSHGKSSHESTLIQNGYALQLARVAQGCPTRIENAKIALLDFDLKKFVLRSAEVLVSDPAELEKIRQREMDITKERIQKILAAGANVILTTKGMDDMSIKYLVDRGVLGVRRVTKPDMKRIAKVCGGKIQLTLCNIGGDLEDATDGSDGSESFDSSQLGHAAIVEEQRVGDNDFIFIKNGQKEGGSKASTILLRGSNEFQIDETERSMDDALQAVSRVAETTSVCPGAGACEMALSLHLEDFALGGSKDGEKEGLDSKEQLAVLAFSEALMIIPSILAQNAALDSIDLVSKLRVAHHKGRTQSGNCIKGSNSSSNKALGYGKNTGLDLVNNTLRDSMKSGVLEPMVSKLKSLKFATEAAITILRIDDLIKLDPEEQQQ